VLPRDVVVLHRRLLDPQHQRPAIGVDPEEVVRLAALGALADRHVAEAVRLAQPGRHAGGIHRR
jgi:hypothetical protein